MLVDLVAVAFDLPAAGGGGFATIFGAIVGVCFAGVNKQECYVFTELFVEFLEVAELADAGRSGVAAEFDKHPAPEVVTQVDFVVVNVFEVHHR